SHTLLVGLDYQHIRTDTRSGSGSAPLLNVLHPDNRQDIAVPVFSKDAVQARYQSGLYFQDQVKLNRLSVLLSGRYDWSRELNQSQSAAVATGRRISSSALRAQAFTGRVGAIYRIDNGL
ncbi:TonB-dependent receptor, partial [Pseudomonas aeruginosa]|nr:TonB-dependent receptor [Pseudomonas aeruginosa]